MGMFDDVYCEVPLPDGWEHPSFQTKSLDEPYLEQYTIKADGTLVKRRQWRLEKGEAPEYEVIPFHGILNFYSYDGDPNDDTPIDVRWHEYNAKFTDGRLVEIEVVKSPRGDGE